MSTPSPCRATRRTPLNLAVSAVGAALLAGVATLVPGSPADAATTQTASCTDGGGVRWTTRAVWGDPYTAADGVRRVRIDDAGWTTTRSGSVPTDSAVQTYDGTGTRLQTLAWTGAYDYRAGAAYKVRNPVNPPSAPGRAKVSVTLGLDGDGFGNCTLTFVQPGTASDTYEADVVTATNNERTSRGLVALTPQECVDSFAETQARRMATEDRLYHQDLGPILSTCHLSVVGENVAYGYTDGTAVTAGWMASPGHRDNLLNPRYRLIGVGAAQNSHGQWYAAQVFGAS